MREVTYRSITVPSDVHSADGSNALRYIVDGYLNEPLFVIRGRDFLGVPTMLYYMKLAANIPGMESQVRQHVERFDAYRVEQSQSMKYPDPYPGWPEPSGSLFAQ